MADSQAEMSRADHALLTTAIDQKKPAKIVEIGVSAGGTTKLILDTMGKDCSLYSVDTDTTYYRDRTKQVGYVAAEHYSQEKHGPWHRYYGQDISACIGDIGGGIDVVVLDTVHILPGEFLSFLTILPYMAPDSVLFLHDISLHLTYKHEPAKMDAYSKSAYCTSLLFNAIPSPCKVNSEDKLPNSGIIMIDPAFVMENIHHVMNLLALDWHYTPNSKVLVETRKAVAGFDSSDALDVFDIGVNYNLALRVIQLDFSKIG